MFDKSFIKASLAASSGNLVHTDMRNSADFTDAYDRHSDSARKIYDCLSVSVSANLDVEYKKASIDVFVFGTDLPEYKDFKVTCMSGSASTELRQSTWAGIKGSKFMEEDQRFDVVQCDLTSDEGKLAIDIGGKVGTKLVSWKTRPEGVEIEHEKGAVLLSYTLGVRLMYPEREIAALREQLEYMPDMIKPHIHKKIIKLKREYNLI